MAEIHIVGMLEGASEFPKPELCCKFKIVTGGSCRIWALTTVDAWTILEGNYEGQTHVDIPLDQSYSLWNHPIDIHYTTKSIAGWPKLIVQVFHQDIFGRNELYGYGFAHIPATPGSHKVEIVTWRPCGNLSDQLWANFLGATPQLKDQSLVYEPVDRFRLLTQSMGKVHAKVWIVIRNFGKTGVNL